MSIIAPPAAEIRCHHHKHGWTFEHRPNLGTFGKISEKLAKQRKFLENWKTKKKFWKIGKPKEELESRVLLVELLDRKTVPPRSSLFLPHWSCRWRSDGRIVYLLYFIFPNNPFDQRTLDGSLEDRGRAQTKERTKAGSPLLSCKTPTGNGSILYWGQSLILYRGQS